MTLRMWSGHGFGFGKSAYCGTKSYHNGGVEGSAFSKWYDGHLKSFFDHGSHWGSHGHGGTKGSGTGGTKGSGSGGTKGSGSGGTKGSGSGGTKGSSTTTVRESLEWNEVPDPDDGGQIDNSDDLSGGFTQDTGNVDVTFKVLATSGPVINEFYNAYQNTADIVDDGEPVDPNSAFSSVMTQEGASAEYELGFSEEVSDVSFRINDVDASAVVRVLAYDEDGNPITVNLTAGSAIELQDTDTVTGADTADSNGPDVPSDSADASVLVDIPGPVSRIVIEHDQDGPENTGIDITDVYFDVTVADDGYGSGGTKGSGSGGTKGGTWGGSKGSGSGGTKGSGSGGTKGSGSGGTKGSGSGGTKGSGSGGTKGSGSGGTKGSGSGGTKGSGSGGTKGSGSGGTKGSGSGGTKGSGSGGTKGSGSGGTKGSGSGGTKGSGSGGTKGSGSGGTKGFGSCGTKGSGSGGTKGFGSGGTKGGEWGLKISALLDLPTYSGDDTGATDSDDTVYASSGTASGGTKGPSLDDILSLMTQEPDEDDPALKASASAGLFGATSGGTGLF